MTPQQIALVQDSWKQVGPMAELAAKMLYTRLFTLDPSLKALFKGNLQEQGRVLMAMMSFAVNSLTRLESALPLIQALGRRHAVYGVEERHYALVEEALIWTLAQGLGSAFTKEVEGAWRAAYGVLATTMKQASAKLAA